MYAISKKYEILLDNFGYLKMKLIIRRYMPAWLKFWVTSEIQNDSYIYIIGYPNKLFLYIREDNHCEETKLLC